jgi:hypothetical protein
LKAPGITDVLPYAFVAADDSSWGPAPEAAGTGKQEIAEDDAKRRSRAVNATTRKIRENVFRAGRIK